jgi:hypothetical protein
MMDFRASLDASSLAELVRLAGFAGLLDLEVQQALTQVGILLVGAAQANTWQVFDNPTGALADSIYFYVISPSEIAVAVGVPYGRRRELGFSGMTDSLGRFYANDPAKPYLQPAVDDNTANIEALMAVAVDGALGRAAV